MAAGASSKSSSKLSMSDNWRDLLKDFEDLTIEKASSPWDRRLESLQFVVANLPLEQLTPTIRRLGMNETCEALANHGLKVASLATSLAQVYKAQDARRERLESDVARLKVSFEKAKFELTASKKAQEDVEEKNSSLERRVSNL